MSKIGLIIESEYNTRVKKKSFILVSLLTPLFVVFSMMVPSLIDGMTEVSKNRIAIVDETGLYADSLQTNDVVEYTKLEGASVDSVKNTYRERGYDGYLHITSSPSEPESMKLYSEAPLPMDVSLSIERSMRRIAQKEIIESYPQHSASVDSLFSRIQSANVSLKTITLSKEGDEQESFAVVGILTGAIAAMLIYMFLIIKGTQVMSGVMEEKTNRIMEVLASTVKPMELMMGKIIGIALVALTQMAIWAVLCWVGFTIVGGVFGGSEAGQLADVEGNAAGQGNELLNIIGSIDFAMIVPMLVIYFIGGYLIYASLFAAVGAACDNPNDGQQFTLPIMLPIFIALYLMMYAMKDPNGPISVWGSIIPFTSPIVMMARLPFNVPTWQIIVSLLSLFVGLVICIWIAAKIYRVGILMYGKKVTFKELVKWFKIAD